MKKHGYLSLLLLGAILLTGCTPDYVNSGVTSSAEILPMNQEDTLMKLNSIATNQVVGSAVLESQMTQYLSDLVDTNFNDKKTIEESIITLIELTESHIEEINSFNPAQAFKQKKSDMEYQLNNAESYLRSLQECVKGNDVKGAETQFSLYTDCIEQLRLLTY